MNFDEAFHHVTKIPGWLGRVEAEELWHLASRRRGGVTVEVGCFLGQTSTLLSALGNVVCIDTWRATDSVRRHLKACTTQQPKPNGNYHHLFRSFAVNGQPNGGNIATIQANDVDLCQAWDRDKISLLVVGFNHPPGAVRHTIRAWRPHLTGSAAIYVQNYGNESVARAVSASRVPVYRVNHQSRHQPACCCWTPFLL